MTVRISPIMLVKIIRKESQSDIAITFFTSMRLIIKVIMIKIITQIIGDGIKLSLKLKSVVFVLCGITRSSLLVLLTKGLPSYVAEAKSCIRLSGKNCCSCLLVGLSAFTPSSISSPSCAHLSTLL